MSRGKKTFWILVTYIFQRHRCVLNQRNNIPTKFDDDRSISNEVATVFRNPRWRRPPSWIFPNMHFRRHWYVPNRNPNVSTNFGDDRSNTKEMTAAFQNPRWRQIWQRRVIPKNERHNNMNYVTACMSISCLSHSLSMSTLYSRWVCNITSEIFL